jgi:hypothetical protein
MNRHSGGNRNPDFQAIFGNWIPAYAGMTIETDFSLSDNIYLLTP